MELLQGLHLDVAEITWLEQLVYACLLLLVVALVDKITKLAINKVVHR